MADETMSPAASDASTGALMHQLTDQRARSELAETAQELTSSADAAARAWHAAVGMRRYRAGLADAAAGLVLTAVVIRKPSRR